MAVSVNSITGYSQVEIKNRKVAWAGRKKYQEIARKKGKEKSRSRVQPTSCFVSLDAMKY